MTTSFISRKNLKRFWQTTLVLSAVATFSSCSQHSNSFASKTFHNTTARYNAYFLAKEKMLEVDNKIWQAHTDDYNRILKVYPTISDGTRSSLKGDLEYIIEKAALPVNKHKNSKWVDNSYNVYGKARLYEKEYKLAVETFKYVNTVSEDPEMRHEAMILLFRTYLDSVQIEHARAVHEYLNKQNFSPVNADEFYLTKAYFHQIQEEYPEMTASLEEAVPFIKVNEDRARTHFILGQLYQKLGDQEKSAYHYNRVFKNNPPYELFFYARLYLAQVSGIGKSDRKKIDKYFAKLLKDKKNTEYRDKIYYEMGKYELRHERDKEAEEFFNLSISESKGNDFQKARTYLALAELYYDKKHDFATAKLYYDSTAALWDKNDKDYISISRRKEVLDEFVGHMNVVIREDSLQRLALLDSAALDKVMDNILITRYKKEQELLERQKKEKEKKKREAENAPPVAVNPMDKPLGYFNNPSAIASGKDEFIKAWGNRPLEDNWRRAKKESEGDYNKVETQATAEIDPEQQRQDSLQAVAKEKERFLAEIPSTQAELDTSHSRIEHSLFELGKIYNLKLIEPRNAIVKFEELIKRYPGTEQKAETYYQLYLIGKNLKTDHEKIYREKLFGEFPNSLYAKLILNPNYIAESKKMNQQAHKVYEQAFDLYREGEYFRSDSVLASIRKDYPDNDLSDKIGFLSLLNRGKTQDPYSFKRSVELYMKQYPSSPLVKRAEELLATTVAYISERESKGFSVQNEVKFMPILEKPHIYVVLTENKSKAEYLKNILPSLGKKDSLQLTGEIIKFNDTTEAVVITGFPGKPQAWKFYNEAGEKYGFIQKDKPDLIMSFVITDDNYTILTTSGNVQRYIYFFRKNYFEHLIYGN